MRHALGAIARRAGIDSIDAYLLLRHKVPGIGGSYIREKALFDGLVVVQERMSAAILILLNGER